jgi:hypothetical protein
LAGNISRLAWKPRPTSTLEKQGDGSAITSAATALLGALHEALVGPLAPDNLDDPGRLRDAVQTVTLLALRAVGVMDARARGLVVQAVLPAKALVGA